MVPAISKIVFIPKSAFGYSSGSLQSDARLIAHLIVSEVLIEDAKLFVSDHESVEMPLLPRHQFLKNRMEIVQMNISEDSN